MLEVYGISQSRALRTLWMLEELGLAYEHVKTNMATGDTRKPEFLKINPNGHVPVLVDGDFTIWESMAINWYLADRYGKGKLWPASEQERGHALQWSFWVVTECETSLLDCLLGRVGPQERRNEAKARAGEEALQGPLGVLDARLAGRDYLLGKSFGLADLNVAAVLGWCKPAQVDLARYPAVAAWLARCTARPAFKTALAR